jgi:hypothetical protein
VDIMSKEACPLTGIVSQSGLKLVSVICSLADLGTDPFCTASFPFWPAVVFEIDDIRVPLDVQSLYKQTQENEKNAGEIVYIVQFYDNKQSW